MATSFAVAERESELADEEAGAAAIECARAYREHLREYVKMSSLDVWYDRLDADTLIAMAPDAKAKKLREDLAEKARRRIADHLFPKIAAPVAGRHGLVGQPPVLYHLTKRDHEERVHAALEAYRLSRPDERRILFDRYRLDDSAVNVVGIGSVGTRCLVALFFSAENHPLLLQLKEACPSVLGPYAGKSLYENRGQRVIIGQRLMQSSSDIFLGWTRGRRGYDFFVRQLRDMKLSFPVEAFTSVQLKRYAVLCGWTLARAHARSGDAALISGYLGKSDIFDQAVGQFALAYASQTERDHAALVAAERTGRIEALVEEDL